MPDHDHRQDSETDNQSGPNCRRPPSGRSGLHLTSLKDAGSGTPAVRSKLVRCGNGDQRQPAYPGVGSCAACWAPAHRAGLHAAGPPNPAGGVALSAGRQPVSRGDWRRRAFPSFGTRPTRKPAWLRIGAMCARPINGIGGKHRGHRFRPDGALYRTGKWLGLPARCARARDRLAVLSCRRRCPPIAASSSTGPT